MLMSASVRSRHQVVLTGSCYLQDPVIGPETGAVGRPVVADHVDVNALLQEAVGHAEAKVIALRVLHHRHL